MTSAGTTTDAIATASAAANATTIAGPTVAARTTTGATANASLAATGQSATSPTSAGQPTTGIPTNAQLAEGAPTITAAATSAAANATPAGTDTSDIAPAGASSPASVTAPSAASSAAPPALAPPAHAPAPSAVSPAPATHPSTLTASLAEATAVTNAKPAAKASNLPVSGLATPALTAAHAGGSNPVAAPTAAPGTSSAGVPVAGSVPLAGSVPPAGSAALAALPTAASATPSAPVDGGPVSYGVDLQQTIEAVHATIELATRQGLTQARIALQPEELGEIRVHLTQSAQGLIARVTADTPAAAQALAAGHAELRQSLSSLNLAALHLDTSASDTPGSGVGAQTGQQSPPRDALPAGSHSAQRLTSPAESEGEESLEEQPASSTSTTTRPASGALLDVLA